MNKNILIELFYFEEYDINYSLECHCIQKMHLNAHNMTHKCDSCSVYPKIRSKLTAFLIDFYLG